MRLAWGRTEQVLALTAAAACTWLVWAVLSSPLMVSRDAALYLESAMVLLEGGTPYIDFVDLNPPLVQYLHVVPVSLAGWLGINAINAFYLLLMVAVGVSTALTFILLRRTSLGDNPWAALCIALTPAVCLLLLSSHMQLGQRILLFMLALLPYLALRLCRYEESPVGLPLSLTIATLLAVTANLKPPHYGAIVIACELMFAGRYLTLTRLIKPETVTLALLTLLYPVALYFLMPPESKTVFFDELLPLIVDSYSAYSPDPAELWHRAVVQLQPATAAILFSLFVLARAGTPSQRDTAILALVIAAVSAYTYMAQAKGWRYHATAAEFAAVLASMTLVGMVLAKARPHPPLNTLRFGLLLTTVMALLLTANTYLVSRSATLELNTGLAEVIGSNSQPGDRIAVLGTSANPQYPLLLQMERRSGTRYPFSFMLPMLYQDATPQEKVPHGFSLPDDWRRDLQDDYVRNLNDDINQLKPELVLILYYKKCFDCIEGLSMMRFVYGARKSFDFLDDYENLEPAEGFIVLKRIRDTAD